ncbi:MULTISPECIES: hypothetical protein [Nostocales]|uniref:Uncharacterized protein n=2 Tax=Tolypothrix TaxID=111782 RepID=A0A0C1QWQ9_9CYAN
MQTILVLIRLRSHEGASRTRLIAQRKLYSAYRAWRKPYMCLLFRLIALHYSSGETLGSASG